MSHIGTFLAGVGVGSVLFPLGLWFWLLLIADCMCLSYLISDGTGYYDEPSTGKATFLTFLTAIILQCFTSIKIFTWIYANPLLALGCFTAYVIIGIAWSFIKWTTLLVDW